MKQQENRETWQQWYQLIVHNIPVALWEYDVPGRHMIRRGINKFRLPQEFDDVPDSFLPYIEDSSIPEFMLLFSKINAGEESPHCEVWYNSKISPSPYCEHVYCLVRKDAAGHPLKVYGIGIDVTSQKMAEAQYSHVMEHTLADVEHFVAVYYLNLTTNKIISGTGKGQSGNELVLAGSYDDLLDRFYDLFVDAEELKEFKRYCTRKAVLEQYQRGINTYSQKIRCQTWHHGVRWLKITYVANQNPTNGDIEVVSYSRDIHDQMILEQAVQHLTKTDLECISLIDLDANKYIYLSLSKEARDVVVQMSKIYDEEILYAANHFVVTEEKEAYLENLLLEGIVGHLEKEETYSYDVSLVDRSGRFCRKMLKYSYLDTDKRRILMTAQDITETYRRQQKQMEQLQKALRNERKAIDSKREFLSNISHDMRTPLNGIIGFTDLALSSRDEKEMREYLQKIKVSGSLLLDLINDTLMLSKLENGKLQAVYEIIDNRTISTRVIVPIKEAAEKKGIHFIADRSKSPQVLLKADRVNTQKIFINLLSNAIKFTPAGGEVAIIMEQLPEWQDGCNFRFVVRDNGIGMSPEFIEKMYEPFSQEQAEGVENPTGTGLGLAIVRQLVNLLGGRIEVRSEQGKGTEFTVYLPLPLATPEEIAAYASKSALHTSEDVWIPTDSLDRDMLEADPDILIKNQAAKESSNHGPGILLVEDNQLNTEIAVTLLERRGYRPVCAKNGKQGVTIFSDSAPGTFTAILMDLRMPVMNGHEAAKAIRRMDRPDAKTIPIIAMSADAFAEDREKSRQAGMNAHLPKPIDPEVMFKTLQKFIDSTPQT